MIDIVTIFNVFGIFFGSIYGALIIIYTVGWSRLKTYDTKRPNVSKFVSIVVPARNEENNIGNLLTDLIDQDFPNNQFEIIIADDNSTDKTAEIVNEFITSNQQIQIKLIKLNEENPHRAYKKNAISAAIETSDGEIIITTDADCRIGKYWLHTLISYYEKYHPKLIVGPVCYQNESSLFEKMQSLEFLSLIAITAGAIKIGRPLMSNGANLAYEKKTFTEVGGFGNDSFSSGDDVFLMLKIRKKFGAKSVRFLKSFKGFVFTDAKKSLQEFIHQRTRWASKNKGYDLKILFVSSTVFMINLMILTGLFASFFITSIFNSVVMMMVVKLLVDIPILIGISKFAKRSKMFIYSFPLIIIYPVYVVFIGTLGILGNYHWKGRKVKK